MTLISTILSVFTWVVLGFALIMMAVNLFIAWRRSWIMALIRIGLTIVSAIVALPIAKVAAGVATDAVYQMLLPMMEGVELAEGVPLDDLLAAVPAGAEGARMIAAMLAGPLIYLIVFIVIRVVLGIIGSIVGTLVPVLKKKFLPASLPLGAAGGLLIAFVVLIPLCGYLTVGAHMMDSAATTATDCDSPTVDAAFESFGVTCEELSTVGEQIDKHPVVGIIHSTVGRPVFNELTTVVLDSTETHNVVIKMNLEEEMGGLVRAGIYLMNAGDALGKEDFTTEDKEHLYDIADNFLETDWRKMVAVDLLTSAASKWRSGDAFLGIARPELDATMDPTMNCLLDILASETVLTLEDDLHDILDVFGDFLVCDLLSSDFDPQEMIKTLSEQGLLNTTLDKLNANPQLAPLTIELKALSIRLLTNVLGLDQLKNGEHADLMNNVAGELNAVLDMSEEERHEVISEALSTAFDEYGVEVPPDVAMKVSDQMIEELGQDGEITGEELTDYLINHVDDAADLIPDDIPDFDVDDLPDDLPTDIPGLPVESETAA